MRYLVLLLLSITTLPAFSQDSLNYSTQEVIYGRKDGLAMTMLVLQPRKSNQRGIISMVSGNWVSSLRRTDRWIDISKIYLEKGYTVFLVAHGSQPRYSVQDAAADVKRAVQFVRYNAALYNISPDHIGAVGSSSGGHLALMAGLADNAGNPTAADPVERVSGKVQAVACFFPPTDFLNYGVAGVTPATQKPFLQQMGLLGAFAFTSYDSLKKVYVEVTDSTRTNAIAKSMSPAHLVTPDDPPVMIWHGDKDWIVPLQQSRILQQKMEALKIPFVLKVKPGGLHGWKDLPEDEKDFIGWFDKYLLGK
jgi:acetyl esterase/lipase